MENNRLSREADNIKSSVTGLIDDLISEIEELEFQNQKLQSEVGSLNNTIEKMADKISEMEEDESTN